MYRALTIERLNEMKRMYPAKFPSEEQIFRHKGDAIKAIYPRLDNEVCRNCITRVFHECHVALPDGTLREAGS